MKSSRVAKGESSGGKGSGQEDGGSGPVKGMDAGIEGGPSSLFEQLPPPAKDADR